MSVVIAFESNTRRLLKAIEIGWDDSDPADVPFFNPWETKNGDLILYYVGGSFQFFFGYSRATSNWRTGRSGPWKGLDYINAEPLRTLREPVPGRDVESATGFKIPSRECVVPKEFEKSVWKAARGKPLIQVEKAMEGATTESRSKNRNPKLRQTALQRSNGICEGCGVNFWRRTGGLGRHCLVVHHKKQLKDTDQPKETKIGELAVVCANCHMMIHANPSKALSLAQLRSRLGR